MRQALRVCLPLMLGAALGNTGIAGFAAAEENQGRAQANEAGPGGAAGVENCATCHAEVARGFASNPHGNPALGHGKSEVTCEGCHGPGRAHVESGGDKSKILNPGTASLTDAEAKCLSCHQGKHANFDRSAHGKSGVSCLGCHGIHGSRHEALLKAPQTELCLGCHSELKTQFSMPFHHKVEEGRMLCSDCHDPHGAVEKKNPNLAGEQNAVCIKCHAETAGPFVYEHAAIKTEGCTACHTAHGGPNAHMLNRAKVNAICQQCHSQLPNFTALSPGHEQAGVDTKPCTGCHSAVHGSNTSKLFQDFR